MTLATRCPACGTAFRVVSDQLRVSSGWVRCGRCHASFDALEHLFRHASSRTASTHPAAADTLSDWPLPSPPAAAPESETTDPPHAQTALDLDLSSPTEPTPVPVAPQHEPAQVEPDELVSPAEQDPGASGSQAQAMHDPGPPAAPEPDPLAPAPPDPAGTPAVDPPPPTTDLSGVRQPGFRPRGRPAFLRRAEAAARWAHPATRATLALLMLLLGSLLAAQAALLWRDEIALRWPGSRAVLEAACAGLGCRIEAPRRIQALAVESSDLRSEPDGATYRLEVAIRNRGPIEVLAPALELSLTDAAGQLIVRRVLTPAELGSPARAMAAGEERLVQAELLAGPPAVAGYTISLFYP